MVLQETCADDGILGQPRGKVENADMPHTVHTDIQNDLFFARDAVFQRCSIEMQRFRCLIGMSQFGCNLGVNKTL